MNAIAIVDARGIRSTLVVNELNQTELVTAAADTSSLNPEEPRSLPVLNYRRITVFDANDNVLQTQVENVLQDGASHFPHPTNRWFTSNLTYDLLDNLLSQTQEVHEAGETRQLGKAPAVSVSGADDATITTRFRYDRNQNQVLALSPITQSVSTLSPATPLEASQVNSVSSSIFDERDLPWKSTQGGIDAQFVQISAANDDLPLAVLAALGVSNTPQTPPGNDLTLNATSSSRVFVDDNGNVVQSIDPVDNGPVYAPHVATADPTTNSPAGDPTFSVLDGFDRVVETVDAMDYRSFQFYDPDSNGIGSKSVGPRDNNDRGKLAGNDRLLASARSFFDELGRVYRSEVDHFQVAPTFTLPLTPTAPGASTPFTSTTLFDADSRVVFQTQPWHNSAPGRESSQTMVYDGRDRVVQRETNPLQGNAGLLIPSTVTYRYNDADQLVQTTEIERNVDTGASRTFYSDSFYDAAGRLDLTVSNHFASNAANATRSEFDSRGNTIRTTDSNSSGTVLLALDRGGPLSVMINATGNASVAYHDGLGRVVATQIELNANKNGGAAALDQSNPSNSDGLITTTRKYDANSRLLSVTDDLDTSLIPPPGPNPSTTRFTYDTHNRRLTQENADGQFKLMAYNRESQQITYQDENDSVQTRTFDDLGRVTGLGIVRAGGAIGTTAQTFQFDGLSRETLTTDDNGGGVGDRLATVTCKYDSLSREIQETQSLSGVAGATGIVGYAYDENNNMTSVTYPGQAGGTPGQRRVVSYSYLDASNTRTLNRLEQVSDAGATLAGYDYEGPSRVTTRRYNPGVAGRSMEKAVSYDALRRVTKLRHARTGFPSPGLIEEIDYTYDRNGNVLSETRNDPALLTPDIDVYHFDSANRRIAEFRGAPAGLALTNNFSGNPFAGVLAGLSQDPRAWTLDGASNWKGVAAGPGPLPSQQLAPDEMNEYRTLSKGAGPTKARTYDDNGNLTDTDSLAADPPNRRVFGYDALNRVAAVMDSAGNVLGRYFYDAGGRRLGRDFTVTPPATPTAVQYFYAGGSVVQEDVGPNLAQRQYVRGGGALLRTVNADLPGLDLFVHENLWGSVMKTTLATSAAPVQDFDYSATGDQVERAGAGFGVQLFGWMGMRNDEETLGEFLFSNAILWEPCTGRTTTRGGGGSFFDCQDSGPPGDIPDGSGPPGGRKLPQNCSSLAILKFKGRGALSTFILPRVPMLGLMSYVPTAPIKACCSRIVFVQIRKSSWPWAVGWLYREADGKKHAIRSGVWEVDNPSGLKAIGVKNGVIPPSYPDQVPWKPGRASALLTAHVGGVMPHPQMKVARQTFETCMVCTSPSRSAFGAVRKAMSGAILGCVSWGYSGWPGKDRNHWIGAPALRRGMVIRGPLARPSPDYMKMFPNANTTLFP
ncbi:MAG: RHS repeat protein [Planctomycetes bacterium]|nr:RHS repeat protein [Planctomycetota bacterium]